MVKRQPDVIFFDAAGTLIYLRKPAGWHYAEISRKYGLDTPPEAMEAAFRQQWKLQKAREPSDTARPGDDRPWWKELALSVLRLAAPDDHDRIDQSAWFDELYEHFERPGVWELHDDVKPCLETLAGRYRLAVLSNFDRRLRRILTDLGVAGYFEHLFISSEMGCEKPHGEIFLRAARGMQVSPRDCLHVGDDPERDWAGAANAGLSAYYLRRPEAGLRDFAQAVT